LVGALLQQTKLRQRIDALDVEGCPRPEIKHGDVVAAAVGLLCLGKSDFNDIKAFRDDPFFRLSLGLRQISGQGGTIGSRCSERTRSERCGRIDMWYRLIWLCGVPRSVPTGPQPGNPGG
jgi:hypothetical protein